MIYYSFKPKASEFIQNFKEANQTNHFYRNDFLVDSDNPYEL